MSLDRRREYSDLIESREMGYARIIPKDITIVPGIGRRNRKTRLSKKRKYLDSKITMHRKVESFRIKAVSDYVK